MQPPGYGVVTFIMVTPWWQYCDMSSTRNTVTNGVNTVNIVTNTVNTVTRCHHCCQRRPKWPEHRIFVSNYPGNMWAIASYLQRVMKLGRMEAFVRVQNMEFFILEDHRHFAPFKPYKDYRMDQSSWRWRLCIKQRQLKKVMAFGLVPKCMHALTLVYEIRLYWCVQCCIRKVPSLTKRSREWKLGLKFPFKARII